MWPQGLVVFELKRLVVRSHYQQIESLHDYVLVAQDRREVELWHLGDAGWESAVSSRGETLTLPAIGCTLGIDELYDAAGVDCASP